jgi:hypothetical protein
MKFIDSARHHEKGYRIWKLAHNFKSNRGGKKVVTGSVDLATIDDKNISSLKLFKLEYQVRDGERTGGGKDKKMSFKIKNGKIYFYIKQKLPNGTTQIRDKTIGAGSYVNEMLKRKVRTKFPPINNSDLANLDKEFSVFNIKRINTSKEISVPNKAATRRFTALFNYWLKLNKFPRTFKIQPKETVREALLNFIYPGLKELGINNPMEGVPELKEKVGIKPIIKKYFGYDSKKITKLICENIQEEKNLTSLYVGKVLKGLIPLDFFYPLLENKVWFFLREERKWKKTREFFKARAVPVRLNLIKNLVDARNGYVFTDTINIWHQIKHEITTIPKDVEKDWNKFHDWLAIEQRKIATKPQAIPYTEKELKIDGAEVEDLSIELPKDTHKLIEWGQALSHCVGSYGQYAVEKRCTILGVKKAGKLKYCIELGREGMRQFRGHHNSDPDLFDKQNIENLLKENKII